MKNPQAIGIFDSGIGGLSIARRIREILPNENLLYIADSLHAPYGDKTESFIIERSSKIVQFLLNKNVKAVVIACNTATVSSIQTLRSLYAVPIVGVEPGIKPAAFHTHSGVIGVLATTQTLKSMSFNQLARGFSNKVKIEIQACPGLMEQVEALCLEGEETQRLVKQYVHPLLNKGVDHIVLGCTHYAFLAPLIAKIAGPKVAIINTDVAVANEAARRLLVSNLLSQEPTTGNAQFYTSGVVDIARKQCSALWGHPVNVLQF